MVSGWNLDGFQNGKDSNPNDPKMMAEMSQDVTATRWISQVSSLKMQQPSPHEDDQFLGAEQRACDFWIQSDFPQHWKRICNHTSPFTTLVSLVECPIETLI